MEYTLQIYKIMLGFMLQKLMKEKVNSLLMQSFSFIASELYYDNSKFDQVFDKEKENKPVPKNGVRHACVNYFGGPIHKNELSDYKGFIGTEYIITEENQIFSIIKCNCRKSLVFDKLER